MIATRGLHHLAIRVRDLGAAERFYCGVLGLAVVGMGLVTVLFLSKVRNA